LDPIAKYLKAFQNLHIDRAHGIAPHKPILLLSVLQAYHNNQIQNQRIYITPELVALFKSNWSHLVTSKRHDCRFALPFYYLTSEKFWKLIPKAGFENMLKFKASMRSFANLNAAIDFAIIEDDLFLLIKEKTSNSILKQCLLDTYFLATKDNFSYSNGDQQIILDDIEGRILHEDAAEYRKEIEKLMEQQKEEELFLRGSLFKREIPRIYNNTCCISGMKIDATISVSMVDSCHIVPFSESHDDTITNGIALCPNLHRAFDRGLIGIDNDYRVIVSTAFREEESDYSIKIFENQQIALPNLEKFYPSLANLQWHKENTFKS